MAFVDHGHADQIMATKTTCPYIFSLKLIKLLASCLVLTKPSPFAKKFQFLSDHEKREKKILKI